MNGYTCTKCQTWACSAECERVVVSLQCCQLTGEVSLGSSLRFHSKGPGGISSSGLSCESPNEGQATDVQIVEVQDGGQAQGERVAQLVATASWGQLSQGSQRSIDMATPREGQAVLQGHADGSGPHSGGQLDCGVDVGAGDVTASGDANHQAPTAGLETKGVRYTQQATTASHELSPPVGQEA